MLEDIRFALRTLLKQSGFTAVALATLALGIGANTAIFTVVDGVLLRPLPYPDPDRLVILWMHNPAQGIEEDVTSYPNFTDWRRNAKSFDAMTAYDGASLALASGGEPEQIRGAVVTQDFFRVLGVAPQAGRAFGADEFRPGRHQVAILSDGLWRRRFGADAGIVGRSIRLDSEPFEVVGVMPGSFRFPGAAEIWTPLAPVRRYAQLMERRGDLWLDVLGRLKPGVGLETAQAELDGIAAALEREYPDNNTRIGIRLERLHHEIVGGVERALLVLLAGVGFVLAVACANVANLLLARAAGRQKEIAIRAALGASRARLLRQLVTESLVLAAVGGAIGVLIAFWSVDLLVSLAPADVPRLGEVGIDVTVIAFALAVTAITGVAFGIVPALQVARAPVGNGLKEGGRSDGEGAGGHRLRNALVVAEVALSLVLLAGAGLLIRSFLRLQAVEPGFRTDRILTMGVALPRAKYAEPARFTAFYRQLVESLASAPGVEAAGAIDDLMLTRLPSSSSLYAQGQPPPRPGEVNLPVAYNSVTPAFFRTLDIRMVRGRPLDERDAAQRPPVVLVNEALVRRFFPNEDPIGRRVTFDDPTSPTAVWRTIVGVVADARRYGLDEAPRPELYFPYAQAPRRYMTIVMRTAGDPAALAAVARAAVWGIDPEQPVSEVRTLDQILTRSLAARRFSMLLLAVFAATALALAAVGLYGVVAYSIARRTREFGVRLALGAQPRDLVRLVLAHSLGLTLAGLVIGLFFSLAATRALSTMLYEVSATDPVTLGAISVVLALVAAAASSLPARRALRVDPVVALRAE
jgi:putative ABC transport system permease protein